MIQNAITVVPANLLALNESVFLEIGNDPLDGSLGDADLKRHLAQYHRRVARQQNQHVGVVGQERPAMQPRRIDRRQRRIRRRCLDFRSLRFGCERFRSVVFLGHKHFVLTKARLHNRELSPRLQGGFAQSPDVPP